MVDEYSGKSEILVLPEVTPVSEIHKYPQSVRRCM